jgi:hypothetical protein
MMILVANALNLNGIRLFVYSVRLISGYGHTNGHKTTPEQLELVFSGLETNGLCRWSRCLTGKAFLATSSMLFGDLKTIF